MREVLEGLTAGIDPVLSTVEPYKGNRGKTHRGRCLAIVQSGRQAGELRLRASADGLLAGKAGVLGRKRQTAEMPGCLLFFYLWQKWHNIN
ncbi:hypothetical protein [Cohnella thermotolerans]|uniref:hypothetical protein n=1 Tax=Cohnella thermotolerans TaxID=329858 RepID=UPI001F0A9DE6|nr:hypothetical protein [Cohnella thermotolerans]